MSRGRPQRFDVEKALDAAEDVFRAQGFFGSGVTELMAAMGLGAGSFYSAFAAKSALYERVLDRAAAQKLEATRLALAQPDLHAALTELVVGEANRLFSMRFLAASLRCPEQTNGRSRHGAGVWCAANCSA